MGATIPLKGFTPSVDPTTPGAVLDCANMVPTLRGMQAAPAAVAFGNPAFSEAVTGAASCELLTGAYRTFCGTATKIWEVVSNANDDVSAYAYTGGANKWRFGQFGNATVATNDSDPLQQSISSGAFTNVPSPIFDIQVTDGGTDYTGATVVNITGGGGGTATATPVIVGGVLTGITLTNPGGTANNGVGFTSTPTIEIVDTGGGTGATAVANMQWAPTAVILEIVQGFVFLFNTTDITQGDRPNGWWCSGLYDQTDWVPNQDTQCEFGVIVDTPGKITAGRALGTNIVAYKRNALYYAVYEGPPVVWAFNQISPIIGTPSQDCVVSVGTQLIFLGTDNQVYTFDGTIPLPIGDAVHDWLSDNWSSIYQENVASYHDQPNTLIYWYFCSKNNTTGIPDISLVLNYRTGQFGRADAIVTAACEIISGQITWDLLGALPDVTTWSTLPTIPYNSPYWAQETGLPAIIGTDNILRSLSGVAGESSLTTGWFGDDYTYQYLQGVSPRFRSQPTSCTATAQTIKSLGGTATDQTLGALYDGELAADFSFRYCSVTFNFTGNHEIMGAMPRTIPAGSQ